MGYAIKSSNAEPHEVDELFKVIEKAAKKQVVIMGHFNYPTICWETMERDQKGMCFCDLIMDNYLTQHVLEPTRESLLIVKLAQQLIY